MEYRPFIKVSVGEHPVNDIFYQRLISASITDNSGNEADRFEAEFDDAGNDLQLPQKDEMLTVIFGYLGGNSQKMGRFIVETVSAQGGSGGGISVCPCFALKHKTASCPHLRSFRRYAQEY